MTAVKTAVNRAGLPVSGTLTLLNQDSPANDAAGPGPSWFVAARYGITAFISRIYYDNDASSWAFMPPSAQLTYVADPGCAEGERAFAVGIDGTQSPGNPPSDYALVKTSSATVTADYSLSALDADLWAERRHSPAAGRDGSPVYAHETVFEHTWEPREHPWTYSATCGTVTVSGEQTWDSGLEIWVPDFLALSDAYLLFGQSQGTGGLDYQSATLAIGGQAVDFSHRHKTYSNFTLVGTQGTVTVHCDSTGGLSGFPSWLVGYTLGRIVDFSNVYIRDRQSADVDGVRIAGPFQASPRVPASLTWSTTP